MEKPESQFKSWKGEQDRKQESGNGISTALKSLSSPSHMQYAVRSTEYSVFSA